MEQFNVLGIVLSSESDLSTLTDSVVKRAYRKLALKLHPDKNKQDANAEAKFHQLKVAHDELMNPARRDELVLAARAYLQRKKEFANRDVAKRKFAQELEQRDISAPPPSSQGQRIALIRQDHRNMIDKLRPTNTSAFPAPDDTNMDLNYWIDYSLREPDHLSVEKQEKFFQFILNIINK